MGFFQHLEHLFVHWLILFAYEVGNGGAIYWASTQIRDTYPKVFRKLIYLLAIECCAARHSYSVLWLCFDAAAAAVISSMQKWNHKIKSLYATRTEWVLLWYAKLSLARKKWVEILETVPFDIWNNAFFYSSANLNNLVLLTEKSEKRILFAWFFSSCQTLVLCWGGGGYKPRLFLLLGQ